MAAKISTPVLKDAQTRIAQLGVGAALATAVDQRGTRIVFSNLISGGFTLNIINTIFVDPTLQKPESFDALVCILAHECSHVQQGYLVDSVQQELIAYQAGAQVAAALGINYYSEFLGLDPQNSQDLDTAFAHILRLAGNSLPTQTIYKSLPKFQPTGFADNAVAAIKQISAAGIAGLQVLRQPKA